MLLEHVSVTNEKEKARNIAGFFGPGVRITVLDSMGGGAQVNHNHQPSDDRILKIFCSLVVAMREQRRHREIGRKMLLAPVSVTNEKEKTRDTAGFFGTAGAITVLVGIGGGGCNPPRTRLRSKFPLTGKLTGNFSRKRRPFRQCVAL